MMPRGLTCALVLACVGPLAAEDAAAIVRRAVELNLRNSQDARNYSYLQRQDTREREHGGQVKNRRVETWRILMIDGSPYRRLVARNDQPIAAEEQKSEEDKLHWTEGQRNMQTSEQRARRVAEYQRRLDRQREPVKELPDAFNFTLLPDEQLDGRPVYRIDGTPKPGFRPKSQYAAIFPKVKLRLWIDKADYQGSRIEMDVLDSIYLGGILVKIAKGSRLRIEQARVADQIWLPKAFSLSAEARILLVKGLNREMDYTFSDYRKLPLAAPAVALTQKP